LPFFAAFAFNRYLWYSDALTCLLRQVYVLLVAPPGAWLGASSAMLQTSLLLLLKTKERPAKMKT
jgi:hypothetical protein